MGENCKHRGIMIRPEQIRYIHVLKNILGIDDKTYREMLGSFAVCTSKALTEAEADIFIDSMRIKAKCIKNNYYNKYDDLIGRDLEMATPPQLRKIEVLWKEICHNKDPKSRKVSLRVFIAKKFHISDIRFITKRRAEKIIGIMEKIKRDKFLKAI